MSLSMIASSGEVLFRTRLDLFFSTSAPLAGYENRLRRFYFVHRREAGLVQRKAGSSARIDEQHWLFERHIAERLDQRHLDFVSCDRHLQLITELIAELHNIVGVDVRDQVAVWTIKGNHIAGQALVVHGCGLQIETDQLLHCGSDLRPVVAARDVGADGRKNIPAMESRGNI